MDTDADGILDAVDADGDRVPDTKDNVPHNKYIYRTDFNRHTTVSLTGSQRVNPSWTLRGNVRNLALSLVLIL